jgi:hypothetical protein
MADKLMWNDHIMTSKLCTAAWVENTSGCSHHQKLWLQKSLLNVVPKIITVEQKTARKEPAQNFSSALRKKKMHVCQE